MGRFAKKSLSWGCNPRKTFHRGIRFGMPTPRLVVNFGSDFYPSGKEGKPSLTGFRAGRASAGGLSHRR